MFIPALNASRAPDNSPLPLVATVHSCEAVLPMRIVNLNPDSDIGATSWFVDIEDHRLLMDAGTHPKREGRGSLPLYDLVKNEDLDAIAVSHCHHDHVGS